MTHRAHGSGSLRSLHRAFTTGQIDRRQFLTRAAALRVSASASAAIAQRSVSAQGATPSPQTGNPGVSGASVAQAVDALDDIIAGALQATGVPAVSVAVVYQDEIVFARGYGVRNTESGEEADADTIFQLASLSKPVASTVVASIVGDGAVTWDTPVVEHLPAFALHNPWVMSQVTLRDMFCHRSGLPEHAGDLLEDMGYGRDEDSLP